MNKISTPFNTASLLFSRIAGDADFIAKIACAAECIGEALLDGHTLLIAGNGGSAAEAQHFSAEIVGRYMRERRGYPAIALTTDTSILTAVGNDYAFDAVFARQVEALGRSGDVFVGLSSSGNSENIINALKKARARGLSTVSFTGKGGGKMKGLADIDIIVPSDETPRIQEAHLCIIHGICEMLDERLA
jgi:D-sedoheptulose 7-phosphate isomerase